jgi:hypothetical protein
MKSLPLLLPILALCTAPLAAQSPTPAPATTPAKIATDLFWVADARKMDEFLAGVQAADLNRFGTSAKELPDTRTAWREYSRQARVLAQQGREAEAAARLAQMLKLAAVYRAVGGLENVVRSEDIRSLAGLTAEELGRGVAVKIRSPYLEKNGAQCVAQIEAKAGGDTGRITESFWNHLVERALETHARLSRAGGGALAKTP